MWNKLVTLWVPLKWQQASQSQPSGSTHSYYSGSQLQEHTDCNLYVFLSLCSVLLESACINLFIFYIYIFYFLAKKLKHGIKTGHLLNSFSTPAHQKTWKKMQSTLSI